MVCSGAFALVRRLWASLQVKHQGQYPIHRLLALREFTRSTSLWQVLALLVLTPLPSLAVITLFEVVPLSEPDEGLAQNRSFYAREFLVYFAFCLCLLQQFCWQAGPPLPASKTVLLVNSLVVAVVNVSYTYALALMIGFPVPFTMSTSSPSHLLLETVTLGFSWRRHVRVKPDLMRNIIRAGIFFTCQSTMVIVYPLYYHAFTLLSDRDVVSRPAYLSLLAVIKLISRHLFHRFSRTSDGGDECKPLMIVFNADVLGSLFVAFCMQYKPSIFMAVSLATVKLASAMLSFYDVRAATQKLTTLQNRIDEVRRPKQSRDSHLTLLVQTANRKKSVMDEVEEIAARYRTCAERVSTTTDTHNHTEVRGPTDTFPKMIRSGGWVSTVCCRLLASRVAPVNDAQVSVHPAINPPRAVSPNQLCGLDCSSPTLSAKPAPPVDADCITTELEHLERSYASLVKKFLYMAEFMALVEYVEVVVPMLYCTCDRLNTCLAASTDDGVSVFVII
jgi:hypothetical protein